MSWSIPSALQPPASSAKSFHSSIMTPSGVLITAFGLSSSNTPRSDVVYLDARDPSPERWSWASSWTTDLLQPFQSTIKSPEAGIASNSDSDGLSGGAIAGIVVPLVLLSIVGLPILIYLVRRRMRLIKKRRMAEHFSFSSQEDSADDEGFVSRFFGGGRRDSQRRITNAQYPFGRDANEKEGTFMSDLGNRARGLLKRYSTRSSNSSLGGRHMDRDADEVNMSSGGYTEKELQPMRATMNPRTANWEEIDFGLGRLDESRRASGVTPPAGTDADADAYENSAMTTNDQPLIRLTSPSSDDEDEDDLPLAKVRQQQRMSSDGSPMSDGQMPLIPSLVVQPPSNPSTPGSINTPLHPSPLQASNPFADPMPTVHEYVPEQNQTVHSNSNELDWSALQKELDDKPAFRSISPNSTLRSHQHQPQPQALPQGRNLMNPISRTPVPAYIPTSPTHSSPLARAPSASSAGSVRSATPPQLPPLETYEPFGRTITLVSPKAGVQRRVSETLPLAGRRGSLPSAMVARSPSSSGSTTPTAVARAGVAAGPARRSSNPIPLTQSPSSPSSPGTDGQRRASATSKLRVMNPSSDDESTESMGQAL